VLVVCIGATIGKTALAGCDLGINQQINAVTFNPEKVIPEFGYWACRALVPEIIDNASKNTLPILNKGRFSKLKIPVPSKETQERIAVQLNAAEAAVSEMRQELLKANTASAALRESILRKAFTGEL
jgi:type I restriction enzyme S subunit